MKNIAAICIFLIGYFPGFAQYYMTGEVRDEFNNPLTNARIVLHSSQFVYRSGTGGAFGIMHTSRKDSITVLLDGYIPATQVLDARKYEIITLKPLQFSPTVNKNKLSSITKNLRFEKPEEESFNGETYSSLIRNDFVNALRFPETGFAIHTDKASYSNTRRFLNMNTIVPPDAVRPEEMLNYFNLGFIEPDPDSVFAFHSYVSDCPWNPGSKLLYMQVSAKRIDPRSIPPSNLVFLIDVSGSMDLPNRLPLLKSSFKLLVENLREKDTITIVVYGSTTGVWLKPTSGKEKEKIRQAIEELTPAGSTPGESGIRTAYRVAKSQFIEGGNNRVILATDGDFNVGQSSEEELEKLITQHQQLGIYLTCLGVGMGNYKDSKLEVLARKGNGNFSYLDNEKEAEKVLVKELTQTLYTVADDAYLNVRLNSSEVSHYRLIGYDNKWRAVTDTLSKIEGGEVGSGQNIMVLFELTETSTAGYNFPLADVEVMFKTPYDSTVKKQAYTCRNNYTSFHELPSFYRFASAVAWFSEMLQASKFVKGHKWAEVYQLASGCIDQNDYLQKEFLLLVKKAEKVYKRKRLFRF